MSENQYRIKAPGAGATNIYNTLMDPEPEPQLIYEANIRIRIATIRIRTQNTGAGMTL
jgi:hypothetical protein